VAGVLGSLGITGGIRIKITSLGRYDDIIGMDSSTAAGFIKDESFLCISSIIGGDDFFIIGSWTG
jgi:hypothetical protein